MDFHLGKPILAMSILSLLCGGWLAVQREQGRADLTLWTFDTAQFHAYEKIIHPGVENELGKSITIDLIPARAMDMRLPVLFMSPDSSKEIPDLTEISIGSIGLYLRPPVDDVGLLPLNHYLENSGFREIASLDAAGSARWNARLLSDHHIYTSDGTTWKLNASRNRPDAWIDRIVPARLASATKEGLIFGVPHDVHPVALAFRDDLFREAGVSLQNDAGVSTVWTWHQFQDKCLRFESYWRQHGYPTRHAIELPAGNSGMASILLAQRRLDLIGPDGSIRINDPKVTQTLAFYMRMVAGERRISGESAQDTALEFKDFSDGNLCALLMPDWKVESFRKYAPALAGKMRLIPLPRFEPDDAPTASYGGTLICIPKACPHPDEAWHLIESLYLSPAGLADRKKLGILPPLPEEWDSPEYQQPDAYFGGQPSLEIYANLARQVPPTHTTPINAMALLSLSYVQSRAAGYVRAYGTTGLEHQCQLWLDAAAADLQRRIDHAEFEK